MKAVLIQAPLIWENATKNGEYFAQQIHAVPSDADLVVLPEMFNTGFTMNPQNVAETMDGETANLLKSLAKAKQVAITGSLVIVENGQYYNRLLFVFPSGEIRHYDKRHLFTLAGENKVYTSGKEKLIVDYKGWKICLLICYDLRFPVFARNVEAYDLLVYVANWPKPRMHAWDTLLKARAIENMSYVIGVNRLGNDANGHEYAGHSQVIDCLGNFILEPSEDEGIFTAELDKQQMLETRKKFPFLDDRDQFTVK